MINLQLKIGHKMFYRNLHILLFIILFVNNTWALSKLHIIIRNYCSVLYSLEMQGSIYVESTNKYLTTLSSDSKTKKMSSGNEPIQASNFSTGNISLSHNQTTEFSLTIPIKENQNSLVFIALIKAQGLNSIKEYASINTTHLLSSSNKKFVEVPIFPDENKSLLLDILPNGAISGTIT